MADIRIVSVLTTGEPVSLAEVKQYIRVTNNQDDTLITGMITQARQMAETYLSKDILSKEREVYFSYVDREFDLPFSPIDTTVPITVQSRGEDVDFTTFGFGNPTVRLVDTNTFPDSSNRLSFSDVKATYTTSGLGDEIKLGVLACTAFLYKAAGRGDLDKMKNIMTDYKTFLAPYRRLYI